MNNIEFLIGGLLLIGLGLYNLVQGNDTKNELQNTDVPLYPSGQATGNQVPEHTDKPDLPPGCKAGWFTSREHRILNYDWQKKVSWTRLAREILWFTGPYLAEKGIQYYPGITLRYYSHKTKAGYYHNGIKDIVIYVRSHTTIKEFVDTVLHEVCHHIQNHEQAKQFNKLYDAYTDRFGYYDNPFEVESRRFAGEHTTACLEHLYRKNIIS